MGHFKKLKKDTALRQVVDVFPYPSLSILISRESFLFGTVLAALNNTYFRHVGVVLLVTPRNIFIKFDKIRMNLISINANKI